MTAPSAAVAQNNVMIITGDIHTHWAAEVVENACKNETGYGGYEETGAIFTLSSTVLLACLARSHLLPSRQARLPC
jgi:hypothetical protein